MKQLNQALQHLNGDILNGEQLKKAMNKLNIT